MDWVKVGIAALCGGVVAAIVVALIIIFFGGSDNTSTGSTSSAISKGAVVVFDGGKGCPDGWGTYSAAASRTIVGSSSKGYAAKATGGSSAVTLTSKQIPGHTHSYSDIYYSENGGAIAVPNNLGSGKTDHDNKGYARTVTTASAGGGQSFNNMPPYIALLYCIKQ